MNNAGMTPVLTTLAGACLSTANWQEAETHVAAFYLASLLMKPGYDFLSTVPDLATYVGWQERLVLNASLPPMNAAGLYVLRSHFDGRQSVYSPEDIWALIIKLQPTMVILPEGGGQVQWPSLPETIFPFFPITDLPVMSTTEYGVYLSYDKNKSPFELLQQLAMHQRQACYIAGDLSLPLMQELVKNGAAFVESDRPASDAVCGKIYCNEGDIILQDSALSLQFEPIDKHCNCPTCSQQFTRAYLYHLFEHTPLLAQRLVIQHNVHYCQAMLRNNEITELRPSSFTPD